MGQESSRFILETMKNKRNRGSGSHMLGFQEFHFHTRFIVWDDLESVWRRIVLGRKLFPLACLEFLSSNELSFPFSIMSFFFLGHLFPT